jgi:hypothetical protein
LDKKVLRAQAKEKQKAVGVARCVMIFVVLWVEFPAHNNRGGENWWGLLDGLARQNGDTSPTKGV